MKADSAGSVLLEPNPEQAVGRSQTNARSARGFQNLKLVSKRENLKVHYGTGANQRTDGCEHGYDDGHHHTEG